MAQANVKEVEIDKSGGSATVTIISKNSIFTRVKLFFKGLRFDKPFLKLWAYRMWLSFAFMVEGFLGLITLTLWTRNLTVTPSQKLALQRSYCSDIQKEESKVKTAEENGEVYVPKQVIKDEKEELREFYKKFSEKKKYDERGRLIKKKPESETTSDSEETA